MVYGEINKTAFISNLHDIYLITGGVEANV
jgi:hypothetical protein